MSLRTRRPWDGMVGEVFDLLRLIPDHDAFVVFSRALRKAQRKPIVMALGLLVTLIAISVWILTGLAGVPRIWKVVIEALVHLTIVLPLHRLYLRLRSRQLAPLLEAELHTFADEMRTLPAEENVFKRLRLAEHSSSR